MHALFHRTRAALGALAFVLLTAASAAAQDGPAPTSPAETVLTLDEALALAFDWNIDLAQATTDTPS